MSQIDKDQIRYHIINFVQTQSKNYTLPKETIEIHLEAAVIKELANRLEKVISDFIKSRPLPDLLALSASFDEFIKPKVVIHEEPKVEKTKPIKRTRKG